MPAEPTREEYLRIILTAHRDSTAQECSSILSGMRGFTKHLTTSLNEVIDDFDKLAAPKLSSEEDALLVSNMCRNLFHCINKHLDQLGSMVEEGLEQSYEERAMAMNDAGGGTHEALLVRDHIAKSFGAS